MATAADQYEWHYLPRGRAAHARGGAFGSRHYTARCGTSPALGLGAAEWHGTGTQDEYERAAELPRCRRCTRLIEDDVRKAAEAKVRIEEMRRNRVVA